MATAFQIPKLGVRHFPGREPCMWALLFGSTGSIKRGPHGAYAMCILGLLCGPFQLFWRLRAVGPKLYLTLQKELGQ